MKIWIYTLLMTLCYSANSQWYPDRHSTSVKDAWLSCTPSANPNPARATSHWIRYDLGAIYTLSTSKFWNYNAPDNLNRGIQQAAIDISMDGITWQVLDTVIFPKANASGFYEGFEGPDFGAVSARFVLITALSNYGAPCTGLGELKINVLNSPLPMELLTFSGKCESTHVKLNWTTQTEKNSNYFEIETSVDAQLWENSDKVSAAGESLKRKEYHFDIKNSDNGSGYYRLKMVDLDGKYTYSPIIYTDCTSKTDGFSIYPNPAKEYITVFRNTSKNELISYTILDNFGRIIETGMISEKNEINIGQLHSGKYFLQLVVDGTPINKEFMKI